MEFPNSMCDQTQTEIDLLKATTGVKYGIEVIADNSGKYCGNGVKYDTVDLAIDGAYDLASRWMLVRKVRIITKPAE